MRLAMLSGQEARAWRRQVAASATKPGSYIRTLKFPLEKLGQDPLPAELFDNAQALYATTEGVGKGSLLGLLTAIHLCGFRFYDNSTKARLFRSKRCSPSQVSSDDFKDSFLQYFKIPANGFTPDGIYNQITATPRAKKGVAPNYSIEALANRFYPLATKKNMETDKKPVQAFVEFMMCFAKKLKAEFSGYDALSQHPRKALKLFDQACTECGVLLPPIASVADGMVVLRPETTPIDFDPSLLFKTPDPSGDMALHQVVAQKLHLGRREGAAMGTAKEAATYCKAAITTGNHNALSWVYGTGLTYWRETGLEDILGDYVISKDRRDSVLQLKSWFQSLGLSTLFDESEVNYSKYRKIVGGKVDSWISNYLTRLWEIREAMTGLLEAADVLPLEFDDPLMTEVLTGLGFSVQDVRNVIGQVHHMRDRATLALDRLQGQGDSLPSNTDRACIEDLNELLGDIHGRLNMITGRIQRKYEDGELPERFKTFKDWKAPDWLGGYAKLNSISGGPVDARAELDAGLERFILLRQHMLDMAEKTLAWASEAGCLQAPLQARAALEKGRAGQRGQDLLEAEDLARRWLWQRLASMARTGSTALSDAVYAKFEQADFLCRKDRNKLLCNHQGQLYKSPFSTKRHQPYTVDMDIFSVSDPVEAIHDIYSAMSLIADTSSDPEVHGDELRLANLYYSLRMAGLPEKVPTRHIPQGMTELMRVPMTLAVHLDKEQIDRDLFLKLFNLFQSELKGLQNLLFRREFMLRTRFTQIGWDTLFIAAKDRAWTPPPHLIATDKPIGQALRYLDGDMSSPGRAMDILATSDLFTTQTGPHPWPAFLREAPHDWLACLPLRGVTHTVKALPAGKNGLGKPGIVTGGMFRLVGTSAYKGVLDAWLADPGVSMKEFTVLIEQGYEQTTRRDNGRLVIDLKPVRTELRLSLPVEQAALENVEFPMSETIIGIDLGEIGIAYHVVSARTFEPLASGTLRIKSIRNLMHAVNRFRKVRQPRQKFQQRLSTYMAEFRENVTGDVRHHIDSLCALFKGFPVLESSVRNLASGSKQLLLVYDKIINSYAFSGIDAHKTLRGGHWLGALDWRHPFLESVKMDSGKLESLRLFPGTTVAPKWTSQVCSQCRRQPYEAVRLKYGKEGRNIPIHEGGKIEVGDGTLLLRRRDEKVSIREVREARRQKRRLPMNQSIKAGKISTKDLISLLHKQVRQAAESTRSRDTTQSVFHCPYEDCGHVMHADENAAVNITRKWINEKLKLGDAWMK